MFNVEFYAKRDGSEPMKDHLLGLPKKLREKVLRSLVILQQKGNTLRKPDTDDLGEGIFELRTIFGSDIERALFFFTDGKRIIVTHGFIKKTQKTPAREIQRAKEYRADFFARKEGSRNDHAE